MGVSVSSLIYGSLNSLRINRKKGKIPVTGCWFQLNVRGVGGCSFFIPNPVKTLTTPPRERCAILRPPPARACLLRLLFDPVLQQGPARLAQLRLFISTSHSKHRPQTTEKETSKSTKLLVCLKQKYYVRSKLVLQLPPAFSIACT
eukprot:COSAG01_NODE_1939_length_8846_cov_15.705385_4_plen_146_part_00